MNWAQVRAADDEFWNQIIERLVSAQELVLLLERWPRGSGKRSWYALSDRHDLTIVREATRAGSSLTAYFAPNLPIRGVVSPEIFDEARRLLGLLSDNDELIVLLPAEGPELEVEYIADVDELESWSASAQGREVLIGPYPEWLPDGPDVVSSVVPDADGVVRPHPY